jgi:hypothetical protein
MPFRFRFHFRQKNSVSISVPQISVFVFIFSFRFRFSAKKSESFRSTFIPISSPTTRKSLNVQSAKLAKTFKKTIEKVQLNFFGISRLQAT